jgi:hypothetical protein
MFFVEGLNISLDKTEIFATLKLEEVLDLICKSIKECWNIWI